MRFVPRRNMRIHHRAAWQVALLTAAILIVSGCGGDTSDRPSAATDVATQTVTQDGMTLTASVQPTPARIAEPVTLTLSVSAPESMAVEFPKAPPRLGGFVVTGSEQQQRSAKPGQRTLEQSHSLESFTAGPRDIPALTVQYRDVGNGRSTPKQLSTEPVQVLVASSFDAPPDPTQFADIQPVVPMEPGTLGAAGWAALGAAAAVVVLLILFALYNHRSIQRFEKANKAASQPPSQRSGNGKPPSNSTVTTDDPAKLYCRASHNVRTHLERKLHLQSLNLTSHEFLNLLRVRNALPGDQLRWLSDLLSTTERIRFAGHQPSPADARRAFDEAQQFLREQSSEFRGASP